MSPNDGDVVTSPVEIEMEIEDFELQAVDADDGNDGGDDDEADAPDDGAGHLHVIVDEGCVDPGYLIPLEGGYLHPTEGVTQIELDLEPGEYDLCAQAGDDQHNAYNMIDELSIEVAEDVDDGNEDDESETGDDDDNETGDGDNDSDDEN